MNLTELKQVVGTLSEVSKIPAPGFSTSAFDCITGNKLAKVKGSICNTCYARQGFNLFPNTQDSFRKRSSVIDSPYWAKYMVQLIRKNEERRKRRNEPTGYFRWFNSGDLKNVSHLLKIVWIAKETPEIKHWLPTHEWGMVKTVLNKIGTFPDNLCVRISAIMVDDKAPDFMNLPGSGVVYDKKKSNCRAYKGGKKAHCGKCRMCWDKDVKEIYYPWHMGKKVGK